MSFYLVTDTSANLTPELAERAGAAVLPFQFHTLGSDRACEDLSAFDAAAFYGAMRRGTEVRTSLIPPARYAACFREALERGEDVLYVGMSSGISGSCQGAHMAAEELREAYPERRVWVVDTLGASLGEGLLVLEAARYRANGLDAAAAARHLLGLRQRMAQVFTVEDLKYLKQGGRLSGMAAAVGTVLNIKPILKGDEAGKIVSCGKARGRKRSIEALAERYEALAEQPERQSVGIAHADCPEDAALLEELLRRNRPPREILTVPYEPVTGSHVGPGALALFFLGGRDVRKR